MHEYHIHIPYTSIVCLVTDTDVLVYLCVRVCEGVQIAGLGVLKWRLTYGIAESLYCSDTYAEQFQCTFCIKLSTLAAVLIDKFDVELMGGA